MDVVRCSIRAGAKKVIMLYRRDEKTIIRNTTYEEYHEAVEEGVEFRFFSAVSKIVDENDVLKKLKIGLVSSRLFKTNSRIYLAKDCAYLSLLCYEVVGLCSWMFFFGFCLLNF